MKKKLIATVMAATMAVTALTGCGSSSASSAKKDIKVPTKPFGDTVKYDPCMEVHVQSTDRNHQQNIRARYQLADESQNCSDCSNDNDHLEGFWICGCHVYGRPVLTSGRCHGGSTG